MSAIRVFCLAVVAVAWIGLPQAGLAGCKPPKLTEAERKPVPTTNIDQALLSRAITKQTNYFRCKRGLKPLDYDPDLKSAAEIHARNMAKLNKLSHVLPVSGAKTMKQRFKTANVMVKKIFAENIGTEFRMALDMRVFLTDDAANCRLRFQDTRQPVPHHSYGSLAQSMVERWYNSKKHRANMLNTKINRVGAAARFTSRGPAPCGTYYLTQNFAG